MAYEYKNGMKFRVTESKPNKEAGYHYHDDISIKIGTNLPRSIKLSVHDRHKAGVPIPFRVQMKKVTLVLLNNQKLQNKIDYAVNDNLEIAFTFNLISSDKIEIQGII